MHDAHAIASYVGQSLMGNNAEEKAEIIQWLALADDEFLPHVLAWTLPSLSAMQHNKNVSGIFLFLVFLVIMPLIF